MLIEFRPHHFLCTLCFTGKGYSLAFVKNFYKIVSYLKDKKTKIKVVNHTDTICLPCPNRRVQICKSQEKIQQLDHAHQRVLQWKVGHFYTWDKAKLKIARHITLLKFHEICSNCSWKALGICEEQLRSFLSKG